MFVVISYCKICYPPGYMVCTYVPIYSILPSPSLIEDKTHMNTIYIRWYIYNNNNTHAFFDCSWRGAYVQYNEMYLPRI